MRWPSDAMLPCCRSPRCLAYLPSVGPTRGRLNSRFALGFCFDKPKLSLANWCDDESRQRSGEWERRKKGKINFKILINRDDKLSWMTENFLQLN